MAPCVSRGGSMTVSSANSASLVLRLLSGKGDVIPVRASMPDCQRRCDNNFNAAKLGLSLACSQTTGVWSGMPASEEDNHVISFAYLLHYNLTSWVISNAFKPEVS